MKLSEKIYRFLFILFITPITIGFIAYLGFAFVEGKFDIMAWKEATRMDFVGSSFAASIVVLGFIYLEFGFFDE